MAKRSNTDRALIALLNHNSIRDAARASRLSEETLYRYLREPEFLSQYREARRQTVEAAISKLQAATGEAADTLQRNLHCENPAVEVRTAQIILEHSMRGIELTDLLERLEKLESDHRKQNASA